MRGSCSWLRNRARASTGGYPDQEIAEIPEEPLRCLVQKPPDMTLRDFIISISSPLLELLLTCGLALREHAGHHRWDEEEFMKRHNHLEELVKERTSKLTKTYGQLEQELNERKRRDRRGWRLFTEAQINKLKGESTRIH